MYSDMSMRTMARSSSNKNSARARASSVLPTPVGPRNRNVPIGLCGSDRPARLRRIARPLRDDFGYVFLVDFFLQHLLLALQLVETRRLLGDLFVELRHRAVAK